MKSSKELVERLFNSIITPRGKEIADLFNSWMEIAGEDCAAHSYISDLRDGIIFISVDHPGWLQIIHSKQKLILSKIKKNFTDLEIRELRFFIGKEKKEIKTSFSQKDSELKDSIKDPVTDAIIKNDPKKPSKEEFESLLDKLRSTLKDRTVDI